ncbi:hypothetical protein AB8U03_03590 [Clostridium sp. Mt-5]|uniref:Uncharacterized protein n=1 Tax=Clostridium moutaii TaxID=3240932 RepID=A0ABV4BNC7_9CLOT
MPKCNIIGIVRRLDITIPSIDIPAEPLNNAKLAGKFFIRF